MAAAIGRHQRPLFSAKLSPFVCEVPLSRSIYGYTWVLVCVIGRPIIEAPTKARCFLYCSRLLAIFQV
jgi:hypothetical protein